QPLFAAEIAEWIGGGMHEIEAKALRPSAQRFRRDFAPFLVDDRSARRPAVKPRRSATWPAAPKTRGIAGIDIVVRHRHEMVTRLQSASCIRRQGLVRRSPRGRAR